MWIAIKAAAEVTNGVPVKGLSGGDVLHCIHARQTPAGCGGAPECRYCTIRNSVGLAVQGGSPRRTRHTLITANGGERIEAHLLVMTAPIPYRGDDLVLLVLEDITELVELRRILPICAVCHRGRDDREYWQNVEAYCRRKLNIEFSHGLCPDCLKRCYPESVRDES